MKGQKYKIFFNNFPNVYFNDNNWYQNIFQFYLMTTITMKLKNSRLLRHYPSFNAIFFLIKRAQTWEMKFAMCLYVLKEYDNPDKCENFTTQFSGNSEKTNGTVSMSVACSFFVRLILFEGGSLSWSKNIHELIWKCHWV